MEKSLTPLERLHDVHVQMQQLQERLRHEPYLDVAKVNAKVHERLERVLAASKR